MYLGWSGIFRLGLVQASLGAIVVLTTSTLNRVMVVELALPAMLPGILVALHYAIQILRPRMGYGSDQGGRRTPWIVGGMAILGSGAVLAALSTAWMASSPTLGITAAAIAFALIGVGVGASGTALLVLLAGSVAPPRRPAAATVTWFMMIVGFIISAAVAGQLLEPFSLMRLVEVTALISGSAVLVTAAAIWGIESKVGHTTLPKETASRPFSEALAEVWREPHARRFTLFLAVSMLAFSAQDLILEPFAGTIFGLSPAETTKLSGLQNGGVLLGMAVVALIGTGLAGRPIASMRGWRIVSCLASGAALAALSVAAFVGDGWPIRASVFILGVTNGAFAVAAIGSMMGLVGQGRARREGIRMGMWGAAQALAFGLAGILATTLVDLMRYAFDSAVIAYAIVFGLQAALFSVAAVLAANIDRVDSTAKDGPFDSGGPLPAEG